MKNGSTPNPARDAAETKEAYIVVETMGDGNFGDCNLFFSPNYALAHIIQAGKTNPKWPPTDWRNAEDFLFSAIPAYQSTLSATPEGDDALWFHVRKVSLSHHQQDGSAPQLDWQPPVAQPLTLETLVKNAINLIDEAQADPDNSDLIADMCEWRNKASNHFIDQAHPDTNEHRASCAICISKFLVVSYDSDQQQWFYDFVIAATDENAQAQVLAARPYVTAADATELPALAIMAATLAQTPAHRIEQEFATLQDVTDRRSTAVRP